MRKPDFHLPVTIESQPGDQRRGIIFKNVPCRVYLPEHCHERVAVHLDLHDGQARVLGIFGKLFWKMSLRGWLRHGGRFWQVEASGAYINNGDWPMVGHGQSFQVIDLPLEVWDLQITNVALEMKQRDEGVQKAGLGQRQKVAKPKKLPDATTEARVTFWLTYNKMLTPFHIEGWHANGEIKVESGEPHAFNITPDVSAKFIEHYTWKSAAQSHDLLRRQELAVQIALPPRGKTPVRVPPDIVGHLDDFLLLVSIGSRWRTVWLGWEVHQSPYATTRYRYGVVLPVHLDNPRRPVEQDDDDALIGPAHFHDFLRHTYDSFLHMSAQQQDVMRQVMRNVVHAQGLDVQSGFIALYAALEMMVLYFRRQESLEFLLGPDDWKQMKADLEEFIKKHPLFQGSQQADRARRQKAYEKVAEFNRIAFGTAFKAFCQADAHPVKYDDLWPVDGQTSLSRLRNRLVHGELEGRSWTGALADAKLHMQWLSERCILAMLGWPLEQSVVSPGMLGHFLAYKTEIWQTSRDVLFQQHGAETTTVE